jgi:anti-sigma-K factor RsiG
MAASLEELTSPAFLADVASVPIADVRAHRVACEDAEAAVSYARRIVQGRLDIAGVGDDAGLMERLPEILADQPPEPSRAARLPSKLVPGDLPDELAAALDAATDVDALEELEGRLSDLRRRLHSTIDALQGELVRRYKSGEADVGSLLG